MDKLLNLNMIGGAMISPPPTMAQPPPNMPGMAPPPPNMPTMPTMAPSPPNMPGMAQPPTGIPNMAPPTGNGVKPNNVPSAKKDGGNTKANIVNVKKNNKKDNTTSNSNKKNNDKGNNDKKNDANNLQNKFNELNNELRERIKALKLTTNNYVIAYWIVWFTAIVIILSSYITNPIRYSEERTFFNLTYNASYYYLFIVLLALICYYAYSASLRLPLIRGGDMYLKLVPLIIFFFGLMAINVSHSDPIKDDGSFNTAPSELVKDEKGMIAQFSLILISIIAICCLDIYKSAGSLEKIQSFHIERCFLPFIGFVIVIYLLRNAVNYRVKKYNLPNTWSK